MSSSPTAHAPHTVRSEPGAAADYRLVADPAGLLPGRPGPLTFRVLAPNGRPVTTFEERHERALHLIVVSDDTLDYAHLHPSLGAAGEWQVELPALAAGGYRLIADTVPTDGPDLALTTDLTVPGMATDAPLPAPASTVAVDDLTVDLDLVPAGDGMTAALAVRRDGAGVDPDPYLGARGHLVAIAVADLAYLHVHPTEASRGPVSFAIEHLTPGRYRLFFDFSVDGRVRTAAFTVDVDDQPARATEHDHARGEEHR